MKLGEYIKQYREEHNMSQRDFASRSGLTNGYISMLENDKNPKTGSRIKPTISTYKAVSAATGIPVQNLMLLVGDDDAGPISSLLGMLELSNGADEEMSDEKKSKFEKIFSTQTTSARVELSSREHRLVAAYRNAPDNIKTGVDAILDPYAEKTDVSVG